MWRTLYPTTDSPHLFWGVTGGVSWVAHWSPVLSNPEYPYVLVIAGKGWLLHTFATRPAQDEVEAAVAGWFRRERAGTGV